MAINSQISQINNHRNRNWHKILPVAILLKCDLFCWGLLKQPVNRIHKELLFNGIEKRPLL